MIFLKKYMEIWYFFQMSWKDGLFERDCAGTWSFWYYLERWYFFPENMIFFPWEESEGRSFSRHTWKYEIFCVHVRFLQTWHCGPLSKKIKDDLIPQKYTRRWLTFYIDILEKAPAILCNFLDTFTGVFICFSPAKKNRKLNI